MQVKELTPADLHKMVTIVSEDWHIYGALRYLSVEPGDEYTQKSPSGEIMVQAYGRNEISITVGPFRAERLTGEEVVKIHE